MFNALFKKATFLKELFLNYMQLTESKLETVDFSLITDTLEELNLSFNPITSVKWVNTIFERSSRIKKLRIDSCSLVASIYT